MIDLRFSRVLLAALVATGVMAGCSGGTTAPVPAAALADSQDAIARIGDVTVRATVMPTASLGTLVAEKYGIRRADNELMLLVGLRQGDDGAEASVAATLVATASDLRGRRSTIALRELQSGELMDYVGTLPVNGPDTLTFEVDVTLQDGARTTLQFTRDVQPD